MARMQKILFASAGLAALFVNEAQAGGFAIREQSAEGQGASFAGVAAGTDGLSSMFWNPATIAQHDGDGLVSESNVALILPYSQAEDGFGAGGSPDSGNIGELALVPSSYWVYEWNDRLTLGMSLNAPFGLTTNADNWTGSPNGDKSEVVTYNLNPNVAYEVSDWLTVAVGVQGEYMAVDIDNRSPIGIKLFDAEGDDIGFGFTAGILIEPNDDLDIGLGFRSSIKHNLEGEAFVGLPADIDIEAAFASPEMVTLGVKQRLGEQFTLMAGVEWANWSRFDELRIKNDAGATVAVTPEKWKDSWFFSVGGEYAWNDALTLRSGIAFEKSPVPDATRTPRVPDNDRLWLSVGASYKISEMFTASLAYSHIFVDDGDVSLAPPDAPAPLDATFEQNIDIISASLTTNW